MRNRPGVTGLLSQRIPALMAVLIAVIALDVVLHNLFFGLILHFDQPDSPLLWHKLSPVVVGTVMLIVIGSALYRLVRYRFSGQAMARCYGARLVNRFDCVPEEAIALWMNENMAQRCQLQPAQLYVLDDELGINALTMGFRRRDTAIIVTWGAMQSLTRHELAGLFAYQYSQIKRYSPVDKALVDVMLSGLLLLSNWGSRLIVYGSMRQTHALRRIFNTSYILLGMLLWLAGSLGLLINRLVKWQLFARREWSIDRAAHHLTEQRGFVNCLRRIAVHELGTHIYQGYAESLAHYCFANPLSEQNSLQLWRSIPDRLNDLQPQASPLMGVVSSQQGVRQLVTTLLLPTNEQHLLEQIARQDQQRVSTRAYLRLTPRLILAPDQMRALPPEVRFAMAANDMLERAMQTSTGCREVITAIMLMRHAPPSDPLHGSGGAGDPIHALQHKSEQTSPAAISEVSQAICDALQGLDPRVYVAVFYRALKRVKPMPRIAAQPWLERLRHLIMLDQQVSLLDVLLLERVRASQQMLPEAIPGHLTGAADALTHLVDALLILSSHYIQHEDTITQLREQILIQLLGHADWPMTETQIDLGLDLAQLAGLLVRERLYMLHTLEQALWLDYPITQEQLDSMALLYWRLGLDGRDAVRRLLQHSRTLF